jgi:hypothetical protein
MKNGQKIKLGDAHVTPRNIQEIQASKLGDAPEAPLLHRQKSGHLSTHYIFITSYSMHFSSSVSYFFFQFSFVLFAAINGLITSCCFGKRLISFFICQEHSSFHSYRSTSVLFFLELRLAFFFFLDFCSDLIFASRCIWTSGLCWFSRKELFPKGLNGVGKEKKFHAKSGTKRSLFRLRLKLFHAMLDVILISMLSDFCCSMTCHK